MKSIKCAHEIRKKRPKCSTLCKHKTPIVRNVHATGIEASNAQINMANTKATEGVRHCVTAHSSRSSGASSSSSTSTSTEIVSRSSTSNRSSSSTSSASSSVNNSNSTNSTRLTADYSFTSSHDSISLTSYFRSADVSSDQFCDDEEQRGRH